MVVCPIVGCLGRVKGNGDGVNDEEVEGETRLGLEVEGVLDAEVDFGVVRLAEKVYKVRADVNGEGWYGREREKAKL